MSKKGYLTVFILLIVTFSAQAFGLVDLPFLPSNILGNSGKLEPDFEMSTHTSIISLHSSSGSSNTTILTVKSINNLKINITFRVDNSHANIIGIIDDVKFKLTPKHICLSPNGEGQCTLTINVKRFISPGKYNINVIGVAGKIKHSLRILLIVTK